MKDLTTLQHYNKLILELDKMESKEKHRLCRYLCRTDLFFLLWYGCSRTDVYHQWILDRCKEVQASPNGHLDLWARGHYKSTIITFGKTIQDVLASHGDDPLPEWEGLEVTAAIFSHTRPIAIKFLSQIKGELENNQVLKTLFPDVLYQHPSKEAPKWSEHAGITVKRKSNPKEQTVEAWGVVEGQPTGIHPLIMNYDDMVTIESVTSPGMIEKTTNNFRISLNLATEKTRKRYVGTFYDFNDTYNQMIKSGTAKPRIYPATLDGSVTGEPVLISKNAIEEKRRDMGPYVFSCQMLLNPIADENERLKREWINFHGGSDGSNLNIYILVDPANELKKSNDYTVMAVIGLGSDENYYLLDLIRDRLNLMQRSDALFKMVRKYRPISVGYEKYGKDADNEHMLDRMRRENYHFNIVPLGGIKGKNDRIKRIIPSLSQGRWYFPDTIYKTNYEGKTQELIDIFINEEYLAFPVPVHDDILDAISRIFDEDLMVTWPQHEEKEKDYGYGYVRRGGQSGGSAWAA